MAQEQTQQTTPPANAGATQTTTAAAPSVSSSFSAAPPPSEPSTPAEPTQAEKAAKMGAITAKMAGKEEPTKPAEPEKPKDETEPQKPKDEPKKTDRNKKLAERFQETKTRLADLESKYTALAAKVKEGEEPSEIDKLKMEQLEEQYNALERERAEAYQAQAQEELGDDYAEFQESSSYYVPLLVKAAPQFATALAQEENKFRMMKDLFQCFTDGSIDMQQFVALPAPRQLKFLRDMDAAIRNPQPPTPPATTAPPVQTIPPVQPPKVPVPNDSAVGSPPTDKNAKMASIIANKSKMR